MKYIRIFKTTAEFEAAKATLPKPWVVLNEEAKKILYSGNGKEKSNFLKVKYNFNGNTLLGTGLLYEAIDAIYVDGELFDIDDLLVEGVMGSGSGSASGSGSGSGAGVGTMSLPEDYTGEHVVEFDLGDRLFKQRVMMGEANFVTIDVPTKNSIDFHANGHEYVDLGLTSGTLWAKYNVGANSEEEFGLYFPWASTVGYPDANGHTFDFTTGNTPYVNGDPCNGGTIEKYNKGDYSGTTDMKEELDIEDDAAAANLGGGWRIPTYKMIVELVKETDQEWTSINGVSGRKFMNKSDHSKFIFIPAAGYVCDSSFKYVGDYGYVWSRSLGTYYSYKASHLDSDYHNASRNDIGRSNGCPVRGIL